MERKLALTATPNGPARYLPISGWLPNYESQWFRADLQAGLTTAAVVIPQSMAYASIAGLPVEVGLYTGLAPMVLYALFGTSRPLSVSTTSSIALLTASALGGLALGSDPSAYFVPAATLALMVGIFLVLAGLLRLGFISNLISDPVLAGFKAGIGVVILVSQLGKVFGLSVESGSILDILTSLSGQLSAVNWIAVAIAVATLAILIGLPRRFSRIPAPLVAVIFGVALSAMFNLGARGLPVVGPIQSGLPSVTLPDMGLLKALWPAALGIALISFVESVAAGHAFTRKDDAIPDANQELVALGLANIGGSLTQAMPAGGGTSQTAVSDEAGARSQMASIVTAAVVMLTLLGLAPLIEIMPQATLGALVIAAASGLIKADDFLEIRNIRSVELAWALVAFLGVIILGTLQGILLAIAVSVGTLLIYAGRPPVYVVGRKKGTDVFRPLNDHRKGETLPGFLMLRTEGIMYFAGVGHAVEKMTDLIHEHHPDVVALDCSAIPNIELTALNRLEEFNRSLDSGGVTLWLCALNPQALKVVKRSALGKDLGRKRMFFNLEYAVRAYEKRFPGHES